MQKFSQVLMLSALAALAPVIAIETDMNPIQKVLALIADVEKKTQDEGATAQAEYEKYADWCEDTSKNLQYEVKTGEATKADLEATIEKMTGNIETETSMIEKLTADIATATKDLKKATEVREQEHADYVAEHAEEQEIISALERSEGDIAKEASMLQKEGGSSPLQTKNVKSVTDALNIVVQASNFSSFDASKLMNFLQDSDSDDMELGAPAAAVYADHGGGTLDVLEKLEEKAKAMMEAETEKEAKAQSDFEMLKDSLKQDIYLANHGLESEKKRLAEDSETKATAEGDLSVTSADLANDIKALEELHTECMTHANDFEAATKDRGEELKALATAKKIIVEATAGAQSVSYSFIQLSTSVSMSTHADLVKLEVVEHVKDLARKQHSSMLAQLASRMNSAIKLGTSESDVFAKVKGLVNDMIAKLEKEAAEDATEAAYCAKETSETTEKKESNEAEIEKLSTKINQAKSRSTKLKAEVATLQEELANLAKSQAEMTAMRSSEKATFTQNESDLTLGISGVQRALKVLNDYYSGKGKGSSAAILSLLEVAESDMSKDLSELTAIEKTAAADYDAQTKENDLTKTTKMQDEKYKTKEFTGLDKAVTELSGDLEGVSTEQDAVLEYLAKINERCVAKAEPYAEIKARREAEIAGLKDALQILEDETALIQKSSKRALRTVRPRRFE